MAMKSVKITLHGKYGQRGILMLATNVLLANYYRVFVFPV